jgi:uncharacterized protein (DUF2141 family)
MNKILIVLLALTLFHCARTTQPTGGPKDVDSPQLINSIPKPSQRNFNGKNIELEFDELIKLKDPKEEILITPSPGPDTKFKLKKNKLTIIPQFEWQTNTTYSIAFRDGIQDLNEGNPADELHLAFSTGETIDSLNIYGSVDELFSEKIPEKITVAAYQIDTFDIFKHKPIFFTKTNKKGKFSLQNLKAGTYFIYAFEDKNKNFKVDSKTEKFGFNTSGITIPEKTDSVRLSIFHCDTRQAKVTSIRNTNTISTIRFNKLLSSIKLKSDNPLLYYFGDNTSEVIIQKNFDPKDSIQIEIHTIDSVQQQLDTTVYIKYTDSKKVEERLKLKEWKTNFDIESKTLSAKTEFNKHIKLINTDSIYVQIDSTKTETISQENIKYDTLFKNVVITKKLKVEDQENKRPNPVLIIGKSAFISIDNDSSKAQQVDIRIPKEAETGTMSIEVQTKEPHFTISLINSKNTIEQSISDQHKFTFKNIPATEYKLLVHIDTNYDKQWNPGNFKKYIAPEKVFFYKFLGKKYTEPIRANWEVGPFLITF